MTSVRNSKANYHYERRIVTLKVSLKAARVNANLTQSEVANRLNISKDKVKYIEKNSEKIEYAFLIQLCGLYKCTTDDIFLPINYPKSEGEVRKEN